MSLSGDEGTNQVDISFTHLANGVTYGAFAAGDAQPSPIATHYKVYFYRGTSAPTNFSTSGWIAGLTYPITTTNISNCTYPDPSGESLWLSRVLVFEGRELPFVSTDAVLICPGAWGDSAPYPTGADVDPCACSGIIVTWPPYPGASGYDIIFRSDYHGYEGICDYLDGSFFENVTSPFVFSNGCGMYYFDVRAKSCGRVTCWSATYWDWDNFVEEDINLSPSAPVITSVVDNDPYAQTGIAITYEPGIPASRHDLYKNGILILSNFVSGSTVGGLDCNTANNFTVKAVKTEGPCLESYSEIVSGTDHCSAPPEIATGLLETDIQSWSENKNTQSWPAFAGATGYKLYRGTQADLVNLPGGAVDNSCLRYDGASTSIDLSGDTPPSESFFWYLVTAYNASGEGPAGTGRIINTSGICTN
mgnify:CR=1 FL=1